MSQLTDNLNQIVSIKSDIKDAIEAKGVSMSGVSFGSYADKIGEITTQFVTEPLNVTDNGTYTPGQGVDGFSQVVVNVPQSVSGFTQKDITEGNYQVVNLNNSASFVKAQAFTGMSTLQTVNLPSCTKVQIAAFSGCVNLQTVSLDICTVISGNAFYNCSSLSSVYAPNCTLISVGTFYGCRNLISIDLPSVTQIMDSAFYNCVSLKYVSIPKCQLISGQPFGATYGAFGRAALESIDLPVCSGISHNAFQGNQSLSQITLGYSSVCYLYNTNAFTATPIASGTGSIYVPASLVDRYKSATNWSVFSSQIFSIPE